MTPIDYNNPNDLWRNNGYDPYKGMTNKERMKAGCLQGVVFIVMLFLGLLLCALLGSCTTERTVTVERVRTDTVRQCLTLRDSIWMHDSIRVTEKGDTVRIEKWHTKYVEKQVHDTIYKSRVDSVPVPHDVIKKVPRERGWLEKLLLGIGGAAVLAVIIGIVVKIKKFLP